MADKQSAFIPSFIFNQSHGQLGISPKIGTRPLPLLTTDRTRGTKPTC